MPILGDFAVKYASRAHDLGVNIGDLYEALVRTGEDTVRSHVALVIYKGFIGVFIQPPDWYMGLCLLLRYISPSLTRRGLPASWEAEYCLENFWVYPY